MERHRHAGAFLHSLPVECPDSAAGSRREPESVFPQSIFAGACRGQPCWPQPGALPIENRETPMPANRPGRSHYRHEACLRHAAVTNPIQVQSQSDPLKQFPLPYGPSNRPPLPFRCLKRARWPTDLPLLPTAPRHVHSAFLEIAGILHPPALRQTNLRKSEIWRSAPFGVPGCRADGGHRAFQWPREVGKRFADLGCVTHWR